MTTETVEREQEIAKLRQAVPLNYVVYVPATASVFGPFSSDGHAQVWAVKGVGGLEHQILRYVDLIEREFK